MEIDVIQTITQCLQADQNAWSEFINEYGPIARKILNKFKTLSSEDQDNITQNVLIKLLTRGFSQFRGRTRYEFLAFFKRVVENEGKDYLKSETRRNEKLIDLKPAFSDPDEEISELSDEIEALQSPNSPPDAVTEQKQVLKIIDHILHQFSLQDQRLFLYKIEGYQNNEISELIGIPMGTIASRYSRIIEKIKESLKKEGLDTFF